MLTRLIKIQLTIFTIVSIVAVVSMALVYIQAPTLLGIDHITVRLELPSGGGIYRFANVTYRGVQVGKVTAVELQPDRVRATLSLDTSPRIPADLRAEVRSVSAVGEQYVDLRPRHNAGPYLEDGSVIPVERTTIPQAVGPMLNKVSALINSIPKDKMSALLDESFKGLNGAGFDLGSLLDSSARVSRDASAVADRTRTLVDDAVPLLDSQAATTDSIRTWARSLAGVTHTLVADDGELRTVLKAGPGAANEVSRLLDQIKPTLPVLLANLTTVGQILVTYNPSLEQLLVLLPPVIASLQASGLSSNNPTGMALGEFAISVADPPPCTAGFLPPSSWRSPADTTTIDTPDGLYCKLPQDSPISVRGARNYPCMGKPGKRAPTVQICDSDKPYEPLAMRQHVLGPYPLDPNLISQGIPPDDRVTVHDRIFGPVDGTALPPGASPSGTPPDAAPSSLTTAGPSANPSVAVAQYDPRTGTYMAPGGQLFQQSDLAAGATPTSWKDMLPR
ncbi:MCE family protein [Mycobacterium sp. 1245805.9]|uniref:MCE family protein n=1 Tax=Mycobacterium sp. 1245805.9 TaxID=1856862 RepID=UPI0007FE8B8F|nr:MlaD family protein [Mycobacterium sp. 1245805.9]OBI89226.1 virulence factor Mce [Mycobacterium sp. 1245805.9]